MNRCEKLCTVVVLPHLLLNIQSIPCEAVSVLPGVTWVCQLQVQAVVGVNPILVTTTAQQGVPVGDWGHGHVLAGGPIKSLGHRQCSTCSTGTHKERCHKGSVDLVSWNQPVAFLVKAAPC